MIRHVQKRVNAVIVAISACVASTAGAGQASFAQYPASKYAGRTVMPDFKGKQREFADLRTKLTQGFRGAPSFAGSWRVIEVGCGAGCVSIYLGDLASGSILSTDLGGEDHANLNLRYRMDSRLLLATWSADFEATTCTGQYFLLEGAKLRPASRPGTVACPK